MANQRDERPGDADRIRALTSTAFADAPHSDGTEAAIVAALRAAGALTLSLVIEAEGALIAHAAFSPVTIDGRGGRWFGLGPVSVHPAHQRAGLGGQLIRSGLNRLAANGAAGCVVLGDPAYYGRFGFVADPALVYPGVPTAYFQRLLIHGPAASGTVAYHPGFGAG